MKENVSKSIKLLEKYINMKVIELAVLQNFLIAETDMTDDLQILLSERATFVAGFIPELGRRIHSLKQEQLVFGNVGFEKELAVCPYEDYPERGFLTDDEADEMFEEHLADDWDESDEEWERGVN